MMREGVPTWEEYYAMLAEVVKTRSKDPSTQVGAVLVDKDNQIISTGYNDLPRGAANFPERFTRPEKYDWMVHAEENAIYAAARRGVATEGATLYMSKDYFCCHRCAAAVIQAGIKIVYAPRPALDKPSFRFDKSLMSFEEGGVEVNIYPDT